MFKKVALNTQGARQASFRVLFLKNMSFERFVLQMLAKENVCKELPKWQPVSFEMCDLKFKFHQLESCNWILSPPSPVGRAQVLRGAARGKKACLSEGSYCRSIRGGMAQRQRV